MNKTAKQLRDLEMELEGLKYFIKVLFAKQKVDPTDIKALTDGLKSQNPPTIEYFDPNQL